MSQAEEFNGNPSAYDASSAYNTICKLWKPPCLILLRIFQLSGQSAALFELICLLMCSKPSIHHF